METIARPHDLHDEKGANPIKILEGSISFQNLTFHYGKGEGMFENFNLEVKSKEKIGIIGISGAGKTTLMSLLLRLYDLEGGSIQIDGQEIAKVTQKSLREKIGVVTQEPSLFHRSIQDNIAFGKEDATLEEIILAAKQAESHDFILQLEDNMGRKGYSAHVGERGVKLSGGQRQRIAIARVLLKNAPILVLDEATSALDSESEAAIQSQLKTLMQDKTVIAIAHRLSTIAALDRLVVIDKGQVIESGTHAELLLRNGLYTKLWARQSGGFLGEQ
jgi:ATP-binding cassette subfamily B multidrug efflux pump